MRLKLIAANIALMIVACAVSGYFFTINEPKFDEAAYRLENNVKIYTENYPDKYSDTLSAMLGSEYTISGPESGFRQGEHCDCGYGSYDSSYLEWTASFTSADCGRKIFTFDNSSPLSDQISKFIKNDLSDQFQESMFDTYFSDIPIHQGGSAVYCNLASIRCNPDDVPEMVKKTDAYLNSLSSAENCVKLNELTVNNAFERLPLYLDVHIFIDDENLTDEQTSQYVKLANERAKTLIKEQNALTGNTFNAHILIDTWSSDNTRSDYYILAGEELESGNNNELNLYFYRRVYKSYEGKFW